MSDIRASRLVFKKSKSSSTDTKHATNQTMRIPHVQPIAVKQQEKNNEQHSTIWIKARCVKDINGPLFILQKGIDDKDKDNQEMIYYSFSFQENGNVNRCTERICVDGSESSSSQQRLPEPRDALQILIVRHVSSDNIICIKTPYNKYISSDDHGKVTMIKEAIGPQEQWIPIFNDDDDDGMVSFRHVISKRILSYNPESGSFHTESDNDNDNDSYEDDNDEDDQTSIRKRNHLSSFIVQCQLKYTCNTMGIPSPLSSSSSSNLDTVQYELDQAKKYQSWQDGSSRLLSENPEKKDKKRIHEALLDRRVKMKSDKYCK